MQELQTNTKLNSLSRSDFEHFFRMSIDIMLIADLQGNILDFNSAFERISGFSKQELKDKRGGWDIIHLDDLAEAMEQVRILREENAQLHNFKVRIICKDTSIKYLSFDAVIDRVKELIYAIGRDITEVELQHNLLIQNEERFKSIFQNTTFGILLIDYKGKILEANNILFERLGYNRDEFLNLSLMELVHQEDRENASKYFTNLIAGTFDTTYAERRFVRKNGDTTWSQISCNKVEISANEHVVMAVVEDIDSIKKHKQALLESEEKFRAVFESSSMGIMITKMPGQIIEVNPAFVEMFGYSRMELIKKNIIELTYPADVQRSKKFLEKIQRAEDGEFVIEKRYVKKDGKPFWAKAVVSKMVSLNGEKLGLSIIENIEKKKKTEQALEFKNKELTQINQELEHFAYVASHDLQEPLRTITSFIQILEKRYGDRLDKDGKQFMSFVVEGSKRMQTLIHDLLEYSRINRYNNSYERVDLNDVFTTVNRVLKEKIESNDALIMSENLPVIYGSKLQLTQMFQNLIDNAIKFRGKKKPEMLISVKNLGDKWELAFKDNGIGISQEYFQRIFVIFQRLHTLEEYGGTGIGLAICKKIVERHGGDIWVESSPGKGSTFHLTVAKNLMTPVS